jgi:simple sugar transport system ATP-binding protein
LRGSVARVPAALELNDVDKSFGSVHAVKRAKVAFDPGLIHAVVGENGAGKSTLLKIGAGLVVPDIGEVRAFGERLAPHTPAEALRRGVGMVQQHFALVEAFTALENVVLGAEPSRWGRLDLASARSRVARIGRELGRELPLDAPVATLGVGDRQRIEIARALYREARVLILDEPTAVLTPGEAEALYRTLRALAEAGRAVVVVTHKLDEVRDHADVVTVVRRGTLIETREVQRSAEDVARLAEAIMGHEDTGAAPRVARALGPPVIVLRDVVLGRALRGVSLQVRAGEVVGVAGVEGNGQTELVRALAGLEWIDSGVLAPPADSVAVVHEDRHQQGLVLDAPIRDNVLLGDFARFTVRGLLDPRAMDREARTRIDRAKGPRDLDGPARALSGGNQQKLVVARAIARLGSGARALVVAHPTRGVDIAASRAIHAEILAAAAAGAAVLVVSADLHELRALSDRLIVLARGRVSAELPIAATDAEIGRAMLAGVAAGASA